MSVLNQELEQEFTTITKQVLELKAELKRTVERAKEVNVPGGDTALYDKYSVEYHRNASELKRLKDRGIEISKIIGRDRANALCLIVCCT